MYYFVNFTYKDEIMEADPDVTLLPCEWVVKADSKEEAIEQIKKDISVEERITREQGDLLEMVKREYLYRRCGNMPIREYNKISREMENNPELQYLALKEFNAKQRLTKRLSRQKGFKDMTMAEFNEKINQLIDAKDEEEFNRILKSIQK